MISIPIFILINVVALCAGYAYHQATHSDEEEN